MGTYTADETRTDVKGTHANVRCAVPTHPHTVAQDEIDAVVVSTLPSHACRRPLRWSALPPRALGERRRRVDRVDAAVALDVEAGEDVVGAAEREEPFHLRGADLAHARPGTDVRTDAVQCAPAGVESIHLLV